MNPIESPSPNILAYVSALASLAALAGVFFTFLNQRLTSKEARKASTQALAASQLGELVKHLRDELVRNETRADKLSNELIEIRFKYESHIDKLEEESQELREKNETVRLANHDLRNDLNATKLSHEKERGEWLLRIQELESSLKEERAKVMTLEEKVKHLEDCIDKASTT